MKEVFAFTISSVINGTHVYICIFTFSSSMDISGLGQTSPLAVVSFEYLRSKTKRVIVTEMQLRSV